MQDLVKIGEIAKDGETTAVILKSRFKETYHVYDLKQGSIIAELDDEEQFALYLQWTESGGLQTTLNRQQEEEKDIVTLKMSSLAWHITQGVLAVASKKIVLSSFEKETAKKCLDYMQFHAHTD